MDMFESGERAQDIAPRGELCCRCGEDVGEIVGYEVDDIDGWSILMPVGRCCWQDFMDEVAAS